MLVCGRAKGDTPGANPVWDVMARDLEAWGVDERRIRIEPNGRSTYEQALHAADILRAMGAQRVAVVTEGFHMRRAAGCLARLGFEVFPAPAGTRRLPDPITWKSFVPAAGVFTDSEEAIRETAAVLVYKLRGANLSVC
ncbi:MAG: YdcF family protein [Bryobacterales bacterium]